MADKDFVVKNGIRTVGNSIVANSSQVAIGSNLVINTAAGISANGSYGANGQIIFSNGSAVYWGTPAGVNTDFRYTYTNTMTFAGNLVIANTINANGSVGVNAATSYSTQAFDQVLTTGGPGKNVYWATPAYVNLNASYTYSNTFIFQNTVSHAGPLILDNTLVANGYSGASGQILASNGSGVYWQTLSATAAGQNTYVQFNDSGLNGGAAGFTFNKSTNAVNMSGTLYLGTGTINSTSYSGSANNSTYLNGIASSLYVNTSGTYTLSGGITFGGTTTFTAGISAGGTQGTAGNVLASNGTGVAPYWTTAVTSVSASSPLTATGTTASPTINHSTSGVSASSYTMANITVDAYGHVTSASSGATTSSSTQFGSLGVGTGATGIAGQIVATNNITAYYSDKRLKENVKVIDEALSKVLSITGVTFNSNDLAEKYGYTDKSEQVGVIAQEIQRVLPQAVKPAPFDSEYIDGVAHSKSGENYLTVQYELLIPLLIEAIKEQQRQIDRLMRSKR